MTQNPLYFSSYIDKAGYANAFHALSCKWSEICGFTPNNTWECQLTYFAFVCASFIYLYVVHIYNSVTVPVSLLLFLRRCRCRSRSLCLLALHFSKQNLGDWTHLIRRVKWSKFIATQRGRGRGRERERRVDCTDMDVYLCVWLCVRVRQAFGFFVATVLALGICKCIRLPSF